MTNTKILKLVAVIELLTAFVFFTLAFIFNAGGEKFSIQKGEMSLSVIFLLIGAISLISAPVIYLIAARLQNKSSNKAVYYE
jgi:hypothetical protein